MQRHEVFRVAINPFNNINLPTPRPVGAKQPHCRPGPTLPPGSMRQINHNQAPRPPTLLATNPYAIPSNSSIRVKDIHVIDADVDASVWGMSSQAPLGGEGRSDICYESVGWVVASEEIKVIEKRRPRKSGVKLICRTRGRRGG